MTEELKDLSYNELDMIVKSPLLVNILLSGSDGRMNNKERESLIKYIYSKSNKLGDSLEKFYHHLTENLLLSYSELLQSLPRDHEARNKEIVTRLGKLSQILPKLDPSFSVPYYNSLREISKKTASSAGGFFGLGSLSSKEHKYLLLPMIVDPTVQVEMREEYIKNRK